MENMLANIISTYKTIVVAFAFIAAICFMVNLSKDISHGIQKKKFLKKYGLYTAFMWFCLVMIRIANMLSSGQTLNTSTIVRDVILLIFCAFMIWNVSNWMPSTNESTSGDTVSDEKLKAADVIPVEETDTQYAPVEVAPTESAETDSAVVESVDTDDVGFLVVKKVASMPDTGNVEYQLYVKKNGKSKIITVGKDEYDKYAVGDMYSGE